MRTYVYDDAVICETCADELLMDGFAPVPNEEPGHIGESDRCDLCMRLLLSDSDFEE